MYIHKTRVKAERALRCTILQVFFFSNKTFSRGAAAGSPYGSLQGENDIYTYHGLCIKTLTILWLRNKGGFLPT